LAQLNELTAQPVIGIGHSVGGVATMYAAVKQPDRFRALVLIEPTLLAPPLLWAASALRFFSKPLNIRLADGALRRRRSWESIEDAYEYFKGRRLFQRWPDAVIRSYAESMTRPSRDGVELRWSPEWEARIYHTFDTTSWKLPGKLTIPTLVIRGSLTDTFTDLSALTFRLRNRHAVQIRVDGAGHLVPQEKPEISGRSIANFLAELRLNVP
jgi:pimeloyl-ACP methyl ester carboxylesterase